MAAPETSPQKAQMQKASAPSFKLQGNFLQYLTNFKSMAGLCASLIVLYMMSNDLPAAWDKYQSDSHKVVEMEQTRQKVLTKLEQLQNTSKNIKPLEAEIYKLNAPESPEIATLRIAQEIVTLAEKSHNQYVSLTPQETENVDYSQVIDIPIQPDDAPPPAAASSTNTRAAAPPGASSAGAQNGIVPEGSTGQAKSSAGAASGNKTLDPDTTVPSAKYVLVLKGNMRSLADFVYQLTSFKTLVFIRKVHIGTGATASASAPSDSGIQAASEASSTASAASSEGKKEIMLELTFMVPWIN